MKISTSICVSFIFILAFSFLLSPLAKAQTVSDSSNQYANQNKVYENHISYQKTVWRRSSLTEKQNQPFFVKGNEISKIIIDAVLEGKLKPYRNDSLKTEMSDEEFSENLTIPHDEIPHQGESEGFYNQYNWNEGTVSSDWNEEILEEEIEYYDQFQPNQIYILRTKVNLFFDTRRNRMINKIESIDLIIPAAMNESTGLDKTLASFSYQEVMNYLFEESKFVWYNQKNSRANLNPKEAFDLMLLSGILIQSFDNESYLFYRVNSKEELQKATVPYFF